MRIRFWGTRGSIPVALTPADIRDNPAVIAAYLGVDEEDAS